MKLQLETLINNNDAANYFTDFDSIGVDDTNSWTFVSQKKTTLKNSIKDDVFHKPLQNVNHNIRSNVLSQLTKASAITFGSPGLMLQKSPNEMSMVNAAIEPDIKTLT